MATYIYKQYLLYVIFIILSVANTFAQEIKVKSFSMQMEPMTIPIQRKDNNGNICALVKVIIPDSKAVFEGNLVGRCDYKTSEYWCYLTPGSKHLKIKYPSTQPLLVDFENLIGSGLKGQMIYELYIELPIKSPADFTFPLKGEIIRIESPNEKGLDYGEKIPYVPGYILYKNYNDGQYEEKWEVRYGQFSISHIRIGDKLTVIANDKRYESTTREIEKDDIGSDFIFHIFKKKIPLYGRLVDSESGEPLIGAEVSAGNRYKNIKWFKTDENGKFCIDGLIIDEIYSLNCRNVPIGYPIDKPTAIIPMKFMNNGCIWEIEREKFRITVELNGVNMSEISAICQDGHAALIEPYPIGNDLCYVRHQFHSEKMRLTLKAKGCKTIIIDYDNLARYVNTKLKLQKGNENETLHYLTVNKGNGKFVFEKLKR